MLASYRWLCELAGFLPDVDELERKLTFSGLEVAKVRHRGPEFNNVVVAQVAEKQPHPKSKKLSLVKVACGDGHVDVVCGAANCPGPGGLVVLAREGANVGGMDIVSRAVAGVPSSGMLCAETELDIGVDDDGIMILDEGVADVGTAIVDALDLEDWIFELEVTPNRPDALSHLGLAREICLLFGRPFTPPVATPVPDSGTGTNSLVTVTVEDKARCPRYALLAMEGVSVKESPFSVRYRLHNLGIRPISNIVDMTNLVLMETGQPLHAFDLDKIRDNQIVVRLAQSGEKMVTLDGVERAMSDEDLLICDGRGPVAVAGVMGGLESEVTAETTRILIECAYFHPSTVRRTAKRLKLSSESSYRFERGVDPNGTPVAMSRAAALGAQLAGGVRCGEMVDQVATPIAPIEVTFRPARFEQVMGRVVSKERIREILAGIGASVKDAGADLLVAIPTARPDITREIDLIEEVARVDGMDGIEPVLPRLQARVPDRAMFEYERKARRCLVGLGLQEAITYAFVPHDTLKLLGAANQTVAIANPLNAERATLRSTLLAGLLENLKRANGRYMTRFGQFEVATVFKDEGQLLPTELPRVAAILSGPALNWPGEPERAVDIFDAKGIVQAFCAKMTGADPLFETESENPVFHPRRCLKVSCKGKSIGVLGEFHPRLLNALKLERGVIGFEFDLTQLKGAVQTPAALSLCEYPPVSRDVAFVVEEERQSGPIATALRQSLGPLAVEVSLFDVYRDKQIGDGRKSLAFAVKYRSFDRTLTDKEVDDIHRKGVAAVCESQGLTMR